MKIGIFGSAFNPIHTGHLIFSEQARFRLGLDKVLFVPTANPYHKDDKDLLAYDVRSEMTKVTIDDNKYFEMSDIERNLKSNSYSFDVVSMLKEREEGEYYFVMGSDSFNQLDTWYKYQDLLKLVNLVVFKRPGYEIDLEILENYRKIGKEIFYFDDLQIQVSSTYIRNSIKEGYIPRYLLTETTRQYIKEHKLW